MTTGAASPACAGVVGKRMAALRLKRSCRQVTDNAMIAEKQRDTAAFNNSVTRLLKAADTENHRLGNRASCLRRSDRCTSPPRPVKNLWPIVTT